MCADNRWELGIETFKKVYGDVIPAPPKEAGDFGKLCIEQQFAEVWARDVMSIRDRRLSLLGVLMALGEENPFRIHAESALANGEIMPTELNEVVIFLTPYVGYPRATKVLPIAAQLAQKYK
ncbi:MAG: carboxymuconolactone decarboxylase family protein [Candidatus Binatia bacterium]